MKTIWWIICVAVLAACATQPSYDQATQLRAELDRVRLEFGLPGMTAAYVLDDGECTVAASGLANVEAGLLMTEQSRMLAASIGKSFVSAVAIALAQEGRLGLDEPVSRWLGAYDWFERLANHETITLRHLLTHSAGLPDHVYMEAFADALGNTWQASENPFPPERLVEFVLDKPALFPAGHGWTYSDTGYILAGLVIEAATGRPYFDELRERFLTRLALLNTSPADRRDLAGLVTGYMSPDNRFGFPVKTLDKHGQLQWHPAVEWTGGGLVSTSCDLARWGATLFAGQAMASEYLPELLSSVAVNPDSTAVQYGAGVAIHSSGPFGPVYGHAGWIPGYTSSLRHYPGYGVTIAFQINTDNGIIDSDEGVLKIIEERLAKLLLTRHY